jgi:hypothetical protein
MLKGRLVLMVMMSALMALACLTSCKKEIVKPNKIEKKMIGEWDFSHYVGAWSEQIGGNLDGDYDYRFMNNDEGQTPHEGGQQWGSMLGEQVPIGPADNTAEFRWELGDNSILYKQPYNYYLEEYQEHALEYEVSMPHKDTLIVGGQVFVRL